MSNIILGSDGITIRQGIYEESLVAKAELGRFTDFQDGRRFRYCRAGSAEIPRALMTNAEIPTLTNRVQTNYGVTLGSKDNISIALETAPAEINEYAGGYLLVDDSDEAVSALGAGYMYKIRKHDIGNDPCHMWLYDEIHVAIQTDDYVTLVKNKYDDLVKTPVSAITAAVIGVPLITVTALYYFWAQTRGYCPILVGTTFTIGYDVGHDPQAAGACENVTNYATPYYGKAVTTGVAGEYAVVDLHLE